MKFETRLVGVSHRPIDIQILIEELTPGAELFLEREPGNAYDPNAIKFLNADEDFLGYVKGTDAQEIAPLLDEDESYTAHVIAGGTARQPKVEIVFE